jgi:hypothetical protein
LEKKSLVLPLLNLNGLETLPESNRRRLAAGPSGAVVHEAGHFLAAAKLGAPADYVLFDWRPQRVQHAVYVREHFRHLLETDPAKRLSVLIAGYVAERRVFGDAPLGRSRSDLTAAVEVLGRRQNAFIFERHGRTLAHELLAYGPFENSDCAAIIDLYNWFAAAINTEGGPTGKHTIAYYRLPLKFRRHVPILRRTIASWTSRRQAPRY